MASDDGQRNAFANTRSIAARVARRVVGLVSSATPSPGLAQRSSATYTCSTRSHGPPLCDAERVVNKAGRCSSVESARTDRIATRSGDARRHSHHRLRLTEVTSRAPLPVVAAFAQNIYSARTVGTGGSVAEWLACWTQAQ